MYGRKKNCDCAMFQNLWKIVREKIIMTIWKNSHKLFASTETICGNVEQPTFLPLEKYVRKCEEHFRHLNFTMQCLTNKMRKTIFQSS
jgi:hypothetical protein